MGSRTTLAGVLARTGAISQQGELLCTLGLAYVLGDGTACTAFVDHLAERCGVEVPNDLDWRAESWQPDGGRPDLEARTPDLVPVVKIEAKLTAPFGEGQLSSYAEDLHARNPTANAVLSLLVPANRLAAVSKVVCDEFALSGNGPSWLVPKTGIVLTVLSWEAVLDILADSADGPLKCDIDQLRGMYLALLGLDIAPLTDPDQLNWRDREGDFNKMVDLATRQLTTQHPLYPMRDWGRDGYFCRYVGRHGPDGPLYSIGVRDPFDPHTTPVWLRYHNGTTMFRSIQARLGQSTHTVVESGGHLWMPIELPTDVDEHAIVAEIIAQAEAIDLAAWGA